MILQDRFTVLLHEDDTAFFHQNSVLRRIPLFASGHPGCDHRFPLRQRFYAAIPDCGNLIIRTAPDDLRVGSRILRPILCRQINALAGKQCRLPVRVRVFGIGIRQSRLIDRCAHPDLTGGRPHRAAARFGSFGRDHRFPLAHCGHDCPGGVFRVGTDLCHLSVGGGPVDRRIRCRIRRNERNLQRRRVRILRLLRLAEPCLILYHRIGTPQRYLGLVQCDLLE